MKPKLHCHVYKNQLLDTTLSQFSNPYAHSLFIKIHFNIILTPLSKYSFHKARDEVLHQYRTEGKIRIV
jgi:hypothetical protein